MAARRHLPVLPSAPAAPAAPAAPGPEEGAEPPPWHWIPIGTVISITGFALLAQGAAALSVAILARRYPRGASVAQIATIRAAHPVSARAVEFASAMVPLAALVFSAAAGAYVCGRRGTRTNAQHGMLSAALTVLVFWAVTGRMATFLALVPVAMAAGWFAAKLGVSRRERAET